MTLNMGPQHPSTHGVLRIVLELEGETIRSAAPDIGFLHTGIEKQCEALTYAKALTLTDRVDYLANLSNNLVYCLTVEKLLQIEIPERAQWMRVMMTELLAAQQPSGVAGHARAGYRRDERLFLLLPRARRDSAHLRNVLRPAHDDQLHPHRRRGAGAAARLGKGRGKIHSRIPVEGRRVRKSARFESHLGHSHQGRRLHFARRHAGPGRHRAHDSRRGSASRLPQERSPIRATTSSISTSPRRPETTCTRGIASVYRKCGRARRSSPRRWKGCRPVLIRPTRRTWSCRIAKK